MKSHRFGTVQSRVVVFCLILVFYSMIPLSHVGSKENENAAVLRASIRGTDGVVKVEFFGVEARNNCARFLLYVKANELEPLSARLIPLVRLEAKLTHATSEEILEFGDQCAVAPQRK